MASVSDDVRRRMFRRRQSLRCRLFEVLEPRCLLATTLMVNTTADDTTADTTLSLREAIELADGTLAFGSLSPQEQAQVSDPALSSPLTINFAIPTSDPGFDDRTGVWTIAPTLGLPDISVPMTINGYSQAGASANTNGVGAADNAKIVIELSGAMAGPGVNGLTLHGGTSTVEGLSIVGFQADSTGTNGDGIAVLTTSGNYTITGNFLGVAPDGTTKLANTTGILVVDSGNNTIGGTTGAAVNVISGNNGVGVDISGTEATGNLLQGNIIGLNAMGTTVLGNGQGGLLLHGGASNNVVGTKLSAFGVVPTNTITGNGQPSEALGDVEITDANTTGNIIADNQIGTDITGQSAPQGTSNSSFGVAIIDAPGNLVGFVDANSTPLGNVIGAETALGPGVSGVGVVISGANATGNRVIANFIGTDQTVTHALGNLRSGVLIADASNNTVGGTGFGVANTITNNGSTGLAESGGIVVISDNAATPSTGNGLEGNNIFANAGLGIDLGGSGVPLVNTPGGPHTGVNDLQNYPVITSVTMPNTTTVVNGTLDSTPNTTFHIDVYASHAPDPSGFGEGEQARGGESFTTDSNGNASFSLDTFENLAGQYLTVTATDPSGNTSEFSQAVQAPLPSPLKIVVNTTSDEAVRDNTLSLREAIELVNGSIGVGALTPAEQAQVTDLPAGNTDQIDFSIPSSDAGFSNGVWTIKPTSALPTLNIPAIIDGYTQPGAAPNTNGPGLGDNAVLKIVLDGSSAGNVDGLTIAGGSTTVRGLAIGNYDGSIQNTLGVTRFDAIKLVNKGGNVIAGDFLGTDATGTVAAPDSQDGVEFASGSSNNTVGGTTPDARNVISGNTSAGVESTDQNTNNNVIEGNLVGTDATGARALVPNIINSGIRFDGGTGNTIGGTSAGARNVISGNAGGIDLAFVGSGGFGTGSVEFEASHTLIEGNFIGTDVTGNVAIPDPGGAVTIFASETTLGGTAPGAGNVIAASGREGVTIDGFTSFTGLDTSGNVVQGNFIGTNALGTAPLGNTGPAIYIRDASNNTIGGTAAGAGNLIANSVNDAVSNLPGSGVQIAVDTNSQSSTTATGNAILGNRIFGNAGLGIDLGGSGVPLANTPGGPHTGPNDLQNAPVLNPPTVAGGKTTITGALNSTPGQTFTVEFYANPTADPSGHGQGTTFLGRLTNVTTDASGNSSLFSLVVNTDLTGQFITATATDPGGNTSEFAANVTSQAAGSTADLAVSSAVPVPNPVAPGGQINYSVTVTNHGPDIAENVVTTVQVPAHTSFVSFTAPAGVTVNVPAVGTEGPFDITATAPLALPNQKENFTLVVQVDASTPNGTVIASSAKVSSDTSDPVSSNNNASASANVTTTQSPTPTPTPSPTSTPLVTVRSVQVEQVSVKVGKSKKAKKQTELVIGFSGAINGAGNLAAYHLLLSKTRKHVTTFTKSVKLTSAVVSSMPAGPSVALILAKKPNLSRPEQLRITASLLTDSAGRALDGNHDGQPGGDYVAVLLRNTVTPSSVTPAARLAPEAVDVVLGSEPVRKGLSHTT
jgi:CSLREA domain-containing protein